MTDKDSPRGGKARTSNGRYVNIAHRRTPSELTPLIQQNMALQQQVEMLTVQNQQMLHQQMAHMGGVPPQGGVPGPGGVPGVPGGVFVSSQMLPPPQLYAPSHHNRGGSHGSHSSIGSAHQFGLGPPQSPGHMRQRSMGHARRHSLAVSEARRAAQERSGGSGSFLGPGSAAGPGPSSGAAQSSPSSSPLDPVAQFRFPPSPERAARSAERGHSRSQSMSSAHRQTPSPQRFTFPPQDDRREFYGHRPRASNASIDFGSNALGGGGNGGGGGRKSLFVPYLPQATIPEMLQEGLLVTGTLRVNHKNRSDAYVTTDLLDADVFIAGSKDRNRALEGDLVAVELLDVNEVWDQKREKEEKKRRRGTQEPAADRLVETQEGQLRRRGSLRQRAPQKRSDDVEVEGQMLLLREELGSGDEKPLYSGHVVAILERPAGQLFSGTLGLLRPSSQATKERQQHSRQASGQADLAPPQQQERPKIVWFKPTEKCVPLMAIPTEQAPSDLVDNPSAYADQIFVAQIKRWPITSLHPFGMLVEKLGQFSDPEVAKTAVLRDYNFGPHRFSEAAAAEAAETANAMSQVAKSSPSSPATYVRPDTAFSLREVDGEQTIAIHVLDVTPYVRRNGLLDRELRHKSAGVYMEGYESPLLAPEAQKLVQFEIGRSSPAITVEIALSSGTVRVKKESIAPEQGSVETFADAASELRKRRGMDAIGKPTLELDALLDVVVPARAPLSVPTTSDAIELELLHAANAAIASELLRSSVGMGTLLRCQPEPPIARLEEFAGLLRSSGLRVDTTSAQTLAHSLAEQLSPRQGTAVTAALAKVLAPQRYIAASKTPPGQMNHYWFGYPAYTHFVRPLHRYADQLVARQVHTMLATREGVPAVDDSGATELAAELTFRYDCARGVQEQSFHLALCQSLSSQYRLESAIVVAVYESAFDIVVPELSVEKRVHGDQLPLTKAEFRSEKRVLELYWNEKVDSVAYSPDGEPTSQEQRSPEIPEDLRAKLTLRPDEHVQEIRLLAEVPILIRVDSGGRVLPSIMVRAANPFFAH